MKKMLLSFAHPDDESFACGGTVAKYVKAGWKVHCIVATNGDAGQVGDVVLGDGESVGDVRRKELKRAASELGIEAVAFLDYRDGALAGLPPGELEEKIHEKMTDFEPDVTITYDTTGVSNHPDHVKICYATTFAFQKYAAAIDRVLHPEYVGKGRGKAYRFMEAMEAGAGDDAAERQEPKLYYACMPESVVQYLQRMKTIPMESFGKPWKGTEDKFITTVIDITRTRKSKIDALNCHKTQSADVARYLSLSTNPTLKQEYFILRMQGVSEVFMGKTDRVSGAI